MSPHYFKKLSTSAVFCHFFHIFEQEMMRLGNTKSKNISFLFAIALAFLYLCIYHK